MQTQIIVYLAKLCLISQMRLQFGIDFKPLAYTEKNLFSSKREETTTVG